MAWPRIVWPCRSLPFGTSRTGSTGPSLPPGWGRFSESRRSPPDRYGRGMELAAPGTRLFIVGAALLISVFRPRGRWLQAQLFRPLRCQLAISHGLPFQLSLEFRIFLLSRHPLELERVLEIFRDHFHSFGPPCTGMGVSLCAICRPKGELNRNERKPGQATSYQCSRPGGVPYDEHPSSSSSVLPLMRLRKRVAESKDANAARGFPC